MIFAGIEIIAGTALTIFTAGTGAVIGAGLIAAGVGHFAAAYNEFKQTGDWGAASKNAGVFFNVSFKTDFGYDDSKNKQNGVTQNAPVINPKSDNGNGNGDGNPSVKDIRVGTLTPSFPKIIEVESNTITLIGIIHGSGAANWVRGGLPALESVSSGLKITGNTLGGVGIAIGAYQYYNNQISGLEFGVDTFVAGAAIVTSIVAAPAVATGFAVGALVYFGGKAIYEYSTGTTLYIKPKLWGTIIIFYTEFLIR